MDGREHLRASRADREQIVGELQIAYVQGRLTKGELDARVGQALAARTYADLGGLTADLPPLPAIQPTRPDVPRVKCGIRASTGIKVGVAAVGVVTFGISTTAGVLGGPWLAIAITIAFLTVTAVTAGFAALLVTAAIKLDERQARRRLPPASSGGRGGATSRQVTPEPLPRPTPKQRDGFSSRCVSLEPRVEPALL
jgi:hypothetical protein